MTAADNTTQIAALIAERLQIGRAAVEATMKLLDEGCTIPFIARYRKERTGGLDEVKIAAISQQKERFAEISKRKETILKTIDEQGHLSDELRQRIADCWEANELEDIYMPFKPKRRTRAQVARELGLEPLASLLLMQREQNPLAAARRFVKEGVADADAAIKGAQDIIAEQVSEDERSRQTVRGFFRRQAMIISKQVKSRTKTASAKTASSTTATSQAATSLATTSQADDEAAAAEKYSDYFDWQEPLKRCPSHRLLAMRRGEEEGFLRVQISPDDDECQERLLRQWVHGTGSCQKLVGEAVTDSYKRLLKPSIETEFAADSKRRADEEAIKVFASNLRQLLLDAPLGQKRVMGIDPGFRTGCKVVCLDEQGSLLYHEAIFPHPPVNRRGQATIHLQQMIQQYGIEAIAIGNGTASRETKAFVEDVLHEQAASHKPVLFVVSENGASVYSASKVARDEFPDQDVTVRGAVSIGRRLMDPLAELVKIDPKSIGVGQYQHDVDQTLLKQQLDQVVESCVNLVGVNVNTASEHLLRYVSGLGPALAANIVGYRREHGPFSSRSQLKKVPRLGPTAYQQCAGFLRIVGGRNPLDATAVHPESYDIVERMAADCHSTVSQLIASKELRARVNINMYISEQVGLPTLTDIMQELDKPGRDPRQQLEAFEFASGIETIDDLEEGMVVPGIVTNITNFGAFVDIGVHQDGLVHVSQIADRYVRDPQEVVTLHQHVTVRVVEVDRRRHRIALSMKL